MKDFAVGTADASPVVLVVDDDAAVRATLADVLRFLGCEPLEARSGLEGIQLAQRNAQQVRAALVDANMPGMTGMDACARIRGFLPDLPLVLITGYGNIGDASRTGVRYVLEKPFGINSLAEVLGLVGLRLDGEQAPAAA